jgi:hypothetical protein
VQAGAPVSPSWRATTSTSYKMSDHISREQQEASTYPPQPPSSTPARSVNTISRVPVGGKTNSQPKVHASVSVAEVCRGNPPFIGPGLSVFRCGHQHQLTLVIMNQYPR